MTEFSDQGPADAEFETLPTSAPRARRGRLWASLAAVAVLAAGGTATYVAFAAGSTGSGSPQAAVRQVLDDLHRSDLIGVLDDLAPGERAAFAGPVQDDIASLKRLGVLTSAADPSAVGGFSFSTTNLTFGRSVVVNDHVQIVRITGGTVDLSADAAKFPLTQRILGLVSHGTPTQSEHHTITRPIRLAAENVGGHWYASLFYTEADHAAGYRVPTASDGIPAEGASSPAAAVETMARSLLGGNLRRALALISPDELGAVHDYGAMILRAAPGYRSVPVSISALDTATTGISGGGERVTVKKVTLSYAGQQIGVALANGCAQVSAGPVHERVCAATALSRFTQLFGAICSSGFGSGSASTSLSGGVTTSIARSGRSNGSCAAPHLTSGQQRALRDLLTGFTSLGIDTAQVGGSWYVTPVRTIADAGATLLAALQGDDIFQLASLAAG